MKKALVGIVLVVAALVAVGGWWYWSNAQSAQQTAAETAVVRKDTLTVAVEATGSLAAAAEQAPAFTSGGRVAEVLVQVGDAVTEGQPLAVLDTEDLMLQLKSAEVNRDSARSALATARSNLSQSQAGATLNQTESAKVKLDKAKDARWGAQAQRDAVCGRTEAKRATQADCDNANASVLQAEDAVRLAELEQADVLDGPDATTLTNARDKVSQAQGQLDGAEVQIEQLRLKLQQATLTAPIAGTVTALDIEPGQQIGAGQAVGTLSNLAELEVEVLLDQTDVARMAVGQPAEVTVDAFRDSPLSGEVVDVALVAETASGVVLYPVTVRLAPAEVPLRVGMTADVSIITERREGALIVPLRAIQSEGGHQFITVQSGDGTRQVEVTLGATTESEAQVEKGLAEGDVVVLPAVKARQAGGFGGPFGRD